MSTEDRPLPEGSWAREEIEFNRVINFTDAVFAIALTLLVVAVGVPTLEGPPDAPETMLTALRVQFPEFASFFIAFIIIGRYWMAHHRFTSLLRAVDTRFITISMFYLAFVAFLPYPTSLVGTYEENPLSVIVFAVCLSIVSSLEVVLFRYAYKNDLLRTQPSPEVYRWEMRASMMPVVMFLATTPLAFISTTLTLTSWLLMIPMGMWLGHHAPEGAAELTLDGPKG